MTADRASDEKEVSIAEGAGEFLHSAAYNFAQAPMDAVAQVLGQKAPQLIAPVERQDTWTAAGGIAASVGQFVIGAKVLRQVGVGSGLVKAGAPIGIMEMATTGAVVDLLHPVAPDKAENLVWEKARSAGVSFGTFATMGGISKYYAEGAVWGRLGRRSVPHAITMNMIAGVGGGMAHTQLDAMSHGHLFAADAKDYVTKAGEYAAFGALFGVAEAGLFRTSVQLGSPKGTARGGAPSSEEFVTKIWNGSQPLESDILSWLADKHPQLRPPNYSQWKAEQTAAPLKSRELDLQDWHPSQRAQVIDKLRQLADSPLATDANIDAFITRINARKEVHAYRQEAWTPERKAALNEWADASRQLKRLHETDMTLWERSWKDILSDGKLHSARPEVAELARRVKAGETQYFNVAEAEAAGSKVQSGLQNELDRISGETYLSRLERGLTIKIDDDGAAYYNNRMEMGDSRITASPGRFSEATIHEFRHHEQPRTLLRELLFGLERTPPVPPGMSYNRALHELRLLERDGGTWNFLQRLSVPENMTARTFFGNGSMSPEIRRMVDYVRDGTANPARWNETAIKAEVKQFLEGQVAIAGKQYRAEHEAYVGSGVEIPAWSLGFLARVRSQALGWSDAAAKPLPWLLSAKDILKEK